MTTDKRIALPKDVILNVENDQMEVPVFAEQEERYTPRSPDYAPDVQLPRSPDYNPKEQYDPGSPTYDANSP